MLIHGVSLHLILWLSQICIGLLAAHQQTIMAGTASVAYRALSNLSLIFKIQIIDLITFNFII